VRKGEVGNFIDIVVPVDFGTSVYFHRRRPALEHYFELLPSGRESPPTFEFPFHLRVQSIVFS
jgi:hypothetical protein